MGKEEKNERPQQKRETTNKKKEAAWESAIPVEGGRSRRSKEPEWVAVKVEKESRSSGDLVIRGADRRHKKQTFDGQNRRETFDRRGRGY